MAWKPKYNVWSYGGGLQSAAIAALIIQKRLPVPEIAVIADTGKECATTWKYLETVVQPAMMHHCLVIDRIASKDWSYYHKTGHDVFNSKGTLQIPAFTNQTGTISKLPGYCSSAWKQEVLDRWLRESGVKKQDAAIWIGYSRDEPKRWARKMATEDFKRGLVSLPLVCDIGFTKAQCRQIVAEMGWPDAPKSRCWICPHQNDDEWLSLTDAELIAAAEFEKEIRKQDPFAWLHRSCKPLLDAVSEARLKTAKTEQENPEFCDTGACFV